MQTTSQVKPIRVPGLPPARDRARVTTLQRTPQEVLQRSIGNGRIARFLQAKLTISQPTDPYEQEADRVADEVMRMPEPTHAIDRTCISQIQRVCPACEEGLERQPLEEEEEQIQTKPLAPGWTVQRQGPEEEEELVQAKTESDDVPEVTAATEAVINALPGRGRPLPESVRNFMEPRFNADFRAVRVHTDAHAHDLARSVKAQAFTVGPNIVFGAGHYAPETEGGRHLIAHELTHVMQQSDNAAVSGRSAEGLLSEGTGGGGTVQRHDAPVRSVVMREECPTGGGRDGRGPATQEHTSDDIGHVVDRWQAHAYHGADEFVTGELERAIASLEDGNWRTFLISLVGNTVWASAAFCSVPAEAFALSMAGVSIAASPTVPSRSSAMQSRHLQVVQVRLHDYIDEVYAQLYRRRHTKARELLAARSGLTRNGAIQEFLAASFPGMYTPVNTCTTEPILDSRRIREAYRARASEIFQLARTPYFRREVDVYGGSGVVTTEEQSFCMVTGVPNGPRLAVVHGMGASIPQQAMRYSFVRWVDHKYLPNVREIIGGEPPSRPASSISGVPTP